jgi:hypothetical protein
MPGWHAWRKHAARTTFTLLRSDRQSGRFLTGAVLMGAVLMGAVLMGAVLIGRTDKNARPSPALTHDPTQVQHHIVR